MTSEGNCRDQPFEIAEALFPIRIIERELIQDSGGPRKFRGGLGLREGTQFLDHLRALEDVGGVRELRLDRQVYLVAKPEELDVQ